MPSEHSKPMFLELDDYTFICPPMYSAVFALTGLPLGTICMYYAHCCKKCHIPLHKESGLN